MLGYHGRVSDDDSGADVDRWPRVVWVLLVVAFAIRAALALGLDAVLVPMADERTYAFWSARWLETGELSSGTFVRPPLYFALTAAAQAGFGESWTLGLRLLQSAAGAALVLPVHAVAQRVGGDRVALVAALAVAVEPTLVAYTHLLWPETVYTLLVSCVFAAVPGLERASVARRLLVGAAIGAALLLKPVFGLFCLLLAGCWLYRLPRARAVVGLALIGGTAALVISPWVVHNVTRFGPTILIENQAPYNLWVGNVDTPGKRVLQEWGGLGDPVARSREATRRGLDAIRADPVGFGRRSVSRLVNLWGYEWFVNRHLAMGGYGDPSKGVFLVLFGLIQLAWFGSFLLAGVGMPRAWADPGLRLCWLFALVFSLLVCTMVGTTRFRLPFVLPVLVTAALGLETLRSRRPTRGAWIGLALAAVLMTASVTKSSFVKIISAQYETPRALSTPEWNFFRY